MLPGRNQQRHLREKLNPLFRSGLGKSINLEAHSNGKTLQSPRWVIFDWDEASGRSHHVGYPLKAT
jgi:hypothetical protein